MATPDPRTAPAASSDAPVRVDRAALTHHLQRQARGAAQAPWLHAEVARRMGERLDFIKAQPQCIVDWWARQGASGELLARRYPKAQRTTIEPAVAMPTPAPFRWRPPWAARPSAAPSPDDHALQPQAQLLWANMMLHWAEPLARTLARWHEALAVDGFLMFSCFGPDTLRELRGLYAELGWGVPASAFIDMHDLGDALVHAGFADPVMDMEMLTLSWGSAEALLGELRTLGANTALQRSPGLRTPRWRQRLVDVLNQRLADHSGRLHLSFEIIYGHAFKPAPRIKAPAETRISLDTMRGLARQRGNTQGDRDP